MFSKAVGKWRLYFKSDNVSFSVVELVSCGRMFALMHRFSLGGQKSGGGVGGLLLKNFSVWRQTSVDIVASNHAAFFVCSQNVLCFNVPLKLWIKSHCHGSGCVPSLSNGISQPLRSERNFSLPRALLNLPEAEGSSWTVVSLLCSYSAF